jgi:hypothetical protein
VSELQISVVLAVSGGGSPAAPAVTALEQSCAGLSAELIVIRTGPEGSGELPRGGFTEIRTKQCPRDALTPVMWGEGVRMARGRLVAFTTDQLRVSPGWARSLLVAASEGVAGVAGPIDLGPKTGATTAAAYFLRFSAFARERWPKAAPARDIPGDNAAYLREAVMRHADLLHDGFWEVEFHRRFEREGLALRMTPDARATFVGPVSFGGMFRQRFRHGMEFGISRVQRHGESRAKLLVSAPLVPFVLLARIGKRAAAVPRTRGRFLAALIPLGVLAGSWAAGEAAGALRSGASGRE